MLTEVVTEGSVARSVEVAEEARMLRRDATAVVERMARQARRAGVDHPVAAAVALSLRVGHLSGPEEFAALTGVSMSRLVEAESGTVRFGDLPIEWDPFLRDLGLDLLSLADLEYSWVTDDSAPTQGSLFPSLKGG